MTPLLDKEEMLRVIHGLYLYEKQLNLIMEFHGDVTKKLYFSDELILTQNLIKQLRDEYIQKI